MKNIWGTMLTGGHVSSFANKLDLLATDTAFSPSENVSLSIGFFDDPDTMLVTSEHTSVQAGINGAISTHHKMMGAPLPGQELDIVVEINKYALPSSRHVPHGMDETYKPSIKLRYDGASGDTHLFTLLAADRVNIYGTRAYVSIKAA